MRALLPILSLAAALPIAAAEQQSAREAPPPARASRDNDKQPQPSPRQDTMPFDDPLARQKLDDDLWITKGLQGGFKTEELWILQPPAGATPAPSNNDTGKPQGRGTFGAWPGTSGARDPDRPADLTDEERARLVKEWERFVFGEPKPPGERGAFTDPWKQPEADDNSPSTPGSAGGPTKPTLGFAPLGTTVGPALPGDFTAGNQTPDLSLRPCIGGSDRQMPFSPVGADRVPGMRPEDWLPNSSRNPGFPLAGTLPQTPQDLPGSGTPTFGAPNASPHSPFAPQMPGMGFGLPQNGFQIPGGTQGPVPAPRAHSTDSFMPRNPW